MHIAVHNSHGYKFAFATNAIAKITSKLSYSLSDKSTVNNVEVRPKFHPSTHCMFYGIKSPPLGTYHNFVMSHSGDFTLMNYFVVLPKPPLRMPSASSSSVIPYCMKIPWANPVPAGISTVLPSLESLVIFMKICPSLSEKK